MCVWGGLSVASHISETSEAIAVTFDTVTASVTRMHHVLIILTSTCIQCHTGGHFLRDFDFANVYMASPARLILQSPKLLVVYFQSFLSTHQNLADSVATVIHMQVLTPHYSIIGRK